MNRDFIIAEHRIRIEGEKLLKAVDNIEGFRPFATTAVGLPLVTVTCENTDTMQEPSFQKEEYNFLFEGIQSTFGRTSNGYLFKAVPNEGDSLYLWREKNDKSFSPLRTLDSLWHEYCSTGHHRHSYKHDYI